MKVVSLSSDNKLKIVIFIFNIGNVTTVRNELTHKKVYKHILEHP